MNISNNHASDTAIALSRDGVEEDFTPQPSSPIMPHTDMSIRMLYVVGGGVGMAERVDVSDLFANRLSRKGLDIDWVFDDSQPGRSNDQSASGCRRFIHGLRGPYSRVVSRVDLWV